MEIRRQTLWIVGLTTAITTIALFIVLKSILDESFMDLESARAVSNMRRTLAAINHEARNLDATVNDWAAWDEAYEFIKSPNDEFIETNIIRSTFEALSINLIMLVDAELRVVAMAVYDLEKGRFIDLPHILKEHLERKSRLVFHRKVRSSINGFVRVGDRAMLVASRPIVTGEHSGPIRGAMIMGRFLSDKGIKQLGARLGLNLEMKVIDPAEARRFMADSGYEDAQGLKIRVLQKTGNIISVFSTIKDIKGEDLILSRIDIPMTIMAKGRETLGYFTIALVSSAVLLLFVSSTLIGRSEKSLINSEQKYRNLVEHSPGIVALVDNGVVSYANKAFSDLLGYDAPSELEGVSFFELATPEFKKVMEFQFHLASEQKKVFPFSEHRMRRKDGSMVHLEATVIPVDLGRSGKGKSATQYVAIDVTEKREAQVALMESERRYRSVVEDQTELICRYRPDGVLTFVNEAYCRYFNKSKSELLGAVFFDFIPEEDLKAVKKYLSSFRTDSSTASYAHRVVWPDGELRWQEWTDRARFDNHGNIVEFQAVGRDITHLRTAYQELNSSRQRLEYLLSSSPAVIYTCRPYGDFGATFVSGNILNQTGWSPENFTDSSTFWLDHIHPEDLDEVMRNSAMIVEKGAMNHEYRFLTRSGEYLWMRDELIVIYNEKGEPEELIGSWVDITERRKAEEGIRSSLKEKEALLQEVHHRVKNNLQIMSSLLDLQANEIVDPKDAALFQDAQGRIWTMALAHEKLYQSDDLSEIPMAEYIGDLAMDIAASYALGQQNVRILPDLAPFTMGIDKAAPCGLIIYELVSNAMKHAFKDGRAGEIRIICKPGPDNYLYLTVQDNGVGMPPQGELPRAKTFGLNLVRNLVDQLDGEFKITFSDGAIVNIKIPIAPRIKDEV